MVDDLVARRDVDLVHGEHDRRGDLGEPGRDEPVAGPDRARWPRSGSTRRRPRPAWSSARSLRALAEQRARLVHPGRVEEHDLGVGCGAHSADLRARRLRPVGDDRDLPADDLIQQRRLPDVRPADERDEPRAELVLVDSAPSLGAIDGGSGFVVGRRRARVMITETMRRPCTRSAQNSRPSTCRHSPSTGTWPSVLNTSPPTVSHSSWGRSTSSSSLTSSIGVRPGTRSAPFGSRSTAGSGDVVLVGDLADDLLEQVLHRDEPGGAAVLVDDDRHVELLGLHLAQELGDALRLGHEVRGPQALAHRLGAVARRAARDEVLQEHEPDDVVGACPRTRGVATCRR